MQQGPKFFTFVPQSDMTLEELTLFFQALHLSFSEEVFLRMPVRIARHLQPYNQEAYQNAQKDPKVDARDRLRSLAAAASRQRREGGENQSTSRKDVGWFKSKDRFWNRRKHGDGARALGEEEVGHAAQEGEKRQDAE